MKRKYLHLDKKKNIILDYTAYHPKLGCRKFAEYFSIGKTALANILKEGKNWRKYFELFKGTYKKHHHGKHNILNGILYIGIENL